MKQSFMIMGIMICNLIVCLSCNREINIVQHDTSLAGSVRMDGYYIEAVGYYDGEELQNLKVPGSTLDINRMTDTTVYVKCTSIWDQGSFTVRIYDVLLTGAPFDVTMEYSGSGANFIHNDVRYGNVDATVEGWITTPDKSQPARGEKSALNYICDIIISCTIDGKLFFLNITAVNQ